MRQSLIRKNKRKRSSLLMAFVFALLLFGFSMDVYASESDKKIVKVGYYPVSNFQEVFEDGSYSGFSYDYYIQIQKYTRWKYEFVQASYAECLQMLENGEIDMMSGLTSTPEREEQFIFADYSVSNSQLRIYARADDPELFYESYDTFDGAKVGMVVGVRSDEWEQYCTEHHFQTQIITYNSYAEMETALQNKEIDLICGASVSESANTKIVGRLRKQPLYYAVTKNKPEIAEELNDALQKIIDNNPEFYTQMSEKYKIDGANATATFTREEEEYIRSGKQIYLVVNNDLAPISWFDEKTGEYKGISADVAKEIENYSGLNITPITVEEYDAMAQENPDIMGDALALTADDTKWATRRNIMMTNHVVNSSIVQIHKVSTNVKESESVIALPKDFYIGFCLKDAMKGKNVVYYETIEECFDAVNDGKADETYMNSLVARYYLSMQKYTNLYVAAESGYAENLSYGVYIDSDTPLLGIIDKSLLCIGTAKIGQIVVKYSQAEEEFSLIGLYYANPTLVIVVILAFSIMTGLIIFFRLKAKNAVKIGRKEKELARFMGYVCAVNEVVMEVDLADFTAKNYSLDLNGEVKEENTPYQQIHYQNHDEQINPEDYEKLTANITEEALDTMIADGGRRYFECRAKGKDGQYHWYAYTMQAIPRDKEHPRNFILFKKNVDSVKLEEEKNKQVLEDALETARDASEAKGNFLSRISHEIRTPLNAVIGYISIARQKDSDADKISHCLENSDIASKHLLAILNDVLDMSSIESGKLKIAKEVFDLEELLCDLNTIYSE